MERIIMTHSENVHFRNLGPQDYEKILELWDTTGLPYKPDGRDSRQEMEKQMQRDPELFIGASIRDELVGVVLGSDDGRKGWINRLAVHPQHLRQGIGSTLLEKCEKQLRERGRGIICAQIEDWNDPSIEFFLSSYYVLHRDILYLTKRESEAV